jgi:signal peptidase I
VPRRPIAEWVVTALFLLFASTSVAWSYVVPTGSMEKTVLVGDHILVDKLAYSAPGAISRYLLPYEEPKHGDIIVFQYPVDTRTTLVKRVIGIPGDRLKIANQQVIRNGVLVREPYVWHGMPFVDSYQANYPPAPGVLSDIAPDVHRDVRLRDMLDHHVQNGELVVPPGCYFAMGDNRENSLDSRYWGFVPRDYILGKPLLVYWSYDGTEKDFMPASADDVWHHAIDLGEHFFTRTRWSRTLRLIRGYNDPQ